MEKNLFVEILKDFAVAFVVAMMIRFIFSLILGTNLPFVAVMSNSMHHDDLTKTTYYIWMEKHGFNKSELEHFPFPHGFNKGDAMIVIAPKNIKIGDVIIYKQPQIGLVIIHRVINITNEGYITKGDHNFSPDPWIVKKEWIIGKAYFKIPFIGWIRVIPTELIMSLQGRSIP